MSHKIFLGFPRGFPFGGRRQNLLSYLVCEILKKFKSHLPEVTERLRHLLEIHNLPEHSIYECGRVSEECQLSRNRNSVDSTNG